jgi:hypothetical protein
MSLPHAHAHRRSLRPGARPRGPHPSFARKPAVRAARLPGDATLHLVSDDRLPPYWIVKERRRSVAHSACIRPTRSGPARARAARMRTNQPRPWPLVLHTAPSPSSSLLTPACASGSRHQAPAIAHFFLPRHFKFLRPPITRRLSESTILETREEPVPAATRTHIVREPRLPFVQKGKEKKTRREAGVRAV